MATSANSTRTPSRRAFLGSAVAAGVGAAQLPMPGAPDPDARLRDLLPNIWALVERTKSASAESSRLEQVAFARVGPSPRAHTEECRAWFARLHEAQEECGQTAASRAFRAAYDALSDALEELAAVPAMTVAGLTAKARLARDHDSEELAESVFDDLLAMPSTN